MAEKSQTLMPVPPEPGSSQGETMEQVCKRLGIPFRDTTAEHAGRTSIVFSSGARSEPKAKGPTSTEPLPRQPTDWELRMHEEYTESLRRRLTSPDTTDEKKSSTPTRADSR